MGPSDPVALILQKAYRGTTSWLVEVKVVAVEALADERVTRIRIN